MKKLLYNIFLLSVFFIAFLISTTLIGEEPDIPLDKLIPDKLIPDNWYGIYLDGRKVGFQNTSFGPIEMNGREYLQVRTQEEIIFFYDLKKHYMRASNSVLFSNVKPWRRVGSSYRYEGPFGKIKTVEERISGDIYEVAISHQGKEEIKKGPMPSETLIDWLSVGIDCIREVNAGHKGELLSWNGEELKDEKESYEFMKIEKKPFQGENIRVASVRYVNPDGDVTKALYEMGTGRLLEMSFKSGIVWKLESKEEANDVAKIHCWILKKYIETDIVLRVSDTRRIESCTLFLPDIEPEDIPKNSRTTTKAVPGGVEVEVRAEKFSPDEKEVETEIPGEIKEFLKESEGIQSEHEEIVDTAEMIVGIVESPAKRAVIINGWISRVIKHEEAFHSDALTTLREKKGDCSEQSALAAALARAVGIPADTVSGVVCSYGFFVRFYFHAWVRYYINGRWVEMDPTNNLIAVDGTYVELSAEAKIKLMGKTIKVLDAQKAPESTEE